MSQKTHTEFIRLFAPLQSQLLGYICSLMPNLNEADDLLQEVAVTGWDKFASFDPQKADFKAWLFGIARYKAMHAKRRFLRTQNLLNEAQSRRAEQYFSEMSLDYMETRQEALRDCMEELSDEQRRIILQRYKEKKTSYELAASFKRSAEQVRIQLFRLRKVLKSCITQKVNL